MKSIIPVVMAGIIAIYGVVVSVLIAGELDDSSKYSLYKWVLQLPWNWALGRPLEKLFADYDENFVNNLILVLKYLTGMINQEV